MAFKKTFIDAPRLVDVLNGTLPTSTKVGFAYDVHGQAYSAFVSTDRETGEVREAGADGLHCGLNWRPARRKG